MENNINKISNFTFDDYEAYISNIISKYDIIAFNEAGSCKKPSLIMRHDIDMSVQNASILSKIENVHGAKTTYFVMLGSWYYDPRDHEINGLIKEIKDLGHNIGLHYDFTYLPSGKVLDFDSYLQSLACQKDELQHILNHEIKVFSLHNPTTINAELLERIKSSHETLGMVNVYSNLIMDKFKYCSDSNGIWRYDKLEDLINPNAHPFLHVLTHPEWWTKHPMSPRMKVEKILFDRAHNTLDKYDSLLKEYGRPNN